eukprot:1672221-Rhodomonas_salina.1
MMIAEHHGRPSRSHEHSPEDENTTDIDTRYSDSKLKAQTLHSLITLQGQLLDSTLAKSTRDDTRARSSDSQHLLIDLR